MNDPVTRDPVPFSLAAYARWRGRIAFHETLLSEARDLMNPSERVDTQERLDSARQDRARLERKLARERLNILGEHTPPDEITVAAAVEKSVQENIENAEARIADFLGRVSPEMRQTHEEQIKHALCKPPRVGEPVSARRRNAWRTEAAEIHDAGGRY